MSNLHLQEFTLSSKYMSGRGADYKPDMLIKLDIPAFFQVLSAGFNQRGQVIIHAEVDRDRPLETQSFVVLAAGDKIPRSIDFHHSGKMIPCRAKYLTTAQSSAQTRHVYRVEAFTRSPS